MKIFPPKRFIQLKLVLLWLLTSLPALASPTITTHTPIPGPYQERTTAFAQVISQESTQISLPFQARLLKLGAEPGSMVGPGYILARFQAPQLRTHLSQWQQAITLAELASQRLQSLQESGRQHITTRQAILAGEEHLSRATANCARAWDTLAADLTFLNNSQPREELRRSLASQGLDDLLAELTIIRAPFAALVRRRPVAQGGMAVPGQVIYELENLDRVYLEVLIPARQRSLWQRGAIQPVGPYPQVSIQSIPQATPRYDQSSGLWLLRLLAVNPGHTLRDGLLLELSCLGAPQPALWLPQAAVVSRNNKTWVVIEDKPDHFQPVAVTVGQGKDNMIPILSPLSPQAKVVSKGAYELLYRDLKDLIKFVD